MNGKEAYNKIFDKLTYDQQQELGEEVLRIVYQDLNRLEKLEKAIEILKGNFKITLSETYYIDFSIEIKKGINFVESIITQEEYELLKEVLGNE